MLKTSEKMRVVTLWWTALLVSPILCLAPRPVLAAVATTAVQDTVYRADGSAAGGTLLVSWPAFSTASGNAVAAGSVTLPIGANGAVNVNLAPNEGATPAGTYYTAVYHLNDGTVSKEFWLVPQVPRTTITAIRTKVVPAAVAMQGATQDYVNSVVNGMAGSFLPLNGGSLAGPLLLNTDPSSAVQAATKHYVDTAVGGVTAGTLGALPIAGGAMTGPLMLSADPAQGQQAATKNYVDTQMAAANQSAATVANLNTRVSKTGDVMSGPLNAPQVNHVIYADQYPTIQAAVTAACSSAPVQEVVIPGSVAVGTASPEFTNPCSAPVIDQRQAHMDVFDTRAFGAVCDGVSDDTQAVQAAINAAHAAVNGPGLRLVQVPAGNCRFNVVDPGGVAIQGKSSGVVNGTTLVVNANGGLSPIITVAGDNAAIRDLTLSGAGGGQFATAQRLERVQGVVTVTLPTALPAQLTAGTRVNIAGAGPDGSVNGIYTVTGVTGNSFTYSQAAPVTSCSFASTTTNGVTATTATCSTASTTTVNGQAAGRWLGNGWAPGVPVTIGSGSGASAFTASGTVTSVGSGNFPDQAGLFPVTFTATIASQSGTFSTENAIAFPSDLTVATGQATVPWCGYCNSGILSAQRSGNVLSVHLVNGSGGWPGVGNQISISGAGDPTLNGTWNVAGDPDVGHGYIFLTNSGPDESVAPGSVGLMQDIGISVPAANNVSIERVAGSNFGEGFVDWEGGERVLLNFVQASNCLLDVNRHTVTPPPVNAPGFDAYPQQNPMGCVVMNGTDGYMQFSEISTGSWNPFGDPSQTTVISAALPSKAIVVGFGGINNWLDSNIGEISDEGLWNGSEFSRFYENRFDLNAGTGMENNGNENVFVGNTVLHDDRDQMVNKGGWYGIDDTGMWESVAGGNLYTGNHALSSEGKCDLHDGLSSASAPPNQWQGNQGNACTAEGYSGAFSFGESDFTPQGVTDGSNGQMYVGGRHNWNASTGDNNNHTIGNFTSGVNGQSVRLLTDGRLTFAGNAGGYGIRTCSGYPYTPVSQWGTANFSLQGEYVKVWQENCDQVAGFQLDPHMALNLQTVGAPETYVSVTGTPGTSTYAYECVSVTRQGTETNGAEAVVTTGPPTLSDSDGVGVSCRNDDPGAYYNRIYRTQVPAGSGLGTGLMAVANAWLDTGGAPANTNLPAPANHTADIQTAGSVSVGGTTTVKDLVVTGSCTGCGAGSGAASAPPSSGAITGPETVNGAEQVELSLTSTHQYGVSLNLVPSGNGTVPYQVGSSGAGYNPGQFFVYDLTNAANVMSGDVGNMTFPNRVTMGQIVVGSWAVGTNGQNGNMYFYPGGHTPFSLTGSGIEVGSGDVLGFAAAPNADLAGADAGFSRTGSAAVACGNGSAGDASCTLAAGSVVTTAATPAGSTMACTPGALWADDNFIYRCSSDGRTVKRSALSSF